MVHYISDAERREQLQSLSDALSVLIRLLLDEKDINLSGRAKAYAECLFRVEAYLNDGFEQVQLNELALEIYRSAICVDSSYGKIDPPFFVQEPWYQRLAAQEATVLGLAEELRIIGSY